MLECLSSFPIRFLFYWLTASGTIGFFVMLIDKARAIDFEWRVPERRILLISAVGGFIGVILGAFIFNHKTSKPEVLLPLFSITVVWLVLLSRAGILGQCFL